MKGFKGISFLILMGLILVLAACGGGDDESSASEDQSSSSDTSEKVVLEASNWDLIKKNIKQKLETSQLNWSMRKECMESQLMNWMALN